MKKLKTVKKEKLANLAQNVLKVVDLVQVKGAGHVKFRYANGSCVDGYGICDPRTF
ncbi:MAG TPA: hypothetical protein VD993_17805 [Chitinophagaceae bacterium]|nr:hypothetical protein [Chitinophagaceae bacterium]